MRKLIAVQAKGVQHDFPDKGAMLPDRNRLRKRNQNKAAMNKRLKSIKIAFLDKGQDFLYWTIDSNGIVTDCGPFQFDIWTGGKVVNFKNLEVGGDVAYEKGYVQMIVKYPITAIIKEYENDECEVAFVMNSYAANNLFTDITK